MIFQEFAELQIQRLSGLQFWSQREPKAIEDLIEVLRVMADDEHEAEAVLSLWLATERECPTPADLRACFAQLREGTRRRPAVQPAACSLCHGTGRTIVYQLCTPTTGEVLAQDLPGGFWEAETIRDRWKAERAAWCVENPTGFYRPPNRQYIAQAARKCGCGQ